MREITIPATTNRLYSFAELSSTAQERAVETTREMLSQAWDGHDNEDIENVLVYTLAEKFGTPGRDAYGVADFPGIDDVSVDGWSLDRQQSLAVSGSLTRANAPALPWVDGIESVTLRGLHQGHGTAVEAIDGDPECTCPPSLDWSVHEDECPMVTDSTVTDDQRDALEQTVRVVLSWAWMDAEKEGDYKTGEEYARAVASDREFTEDGELF